MIEDELRTLLRSRVAAPPDNPTRIASVRSRIATIRRRRAAGGAFTLALLALAGLVVRPLGTNESLPPGVPKPPYFDGVQMRQLPGWMYVGGTWDLAENEPLRGVTAFEPTSETWYLVLTRCEQKGELTVRNRENGENVVARCRIPVGDHFEGAAAVSPEQGRRLSWIVADDLNSIEVAAGSPGAWMVGVQQARAPERLDDNVNIGAPWLMDGRRMRDGGTVEITVPRRRAPGVGFVLDAECVAGVRLTFRVPAGEIGSLTCDPLAPGDERVSDMLEGRVTLTVTSQDLNRLGLARGQRVALTVERSGTATDQWRLYPVRA